MLMLALDVLMPTLETNKWEISELKSRHYWYQSNRTECQTRNLMNCMVQSVVLIIKSSLFSLVSVSNHVSFPSSFGSSKSQTAC